MDKEKVSKFIKSWIDKKQVIPIVISVLMVICVYWSISLQISSIIPNRPVLDVYPAEYLGDPPMLSARCLSDKNVSGGKGENVRLYIKNSGGMETQHMTIEVVSPTFLASNTENIETIEERSTGSGVLYIRQDCVQEKCDQSLLHEGIVSITFKFTCRNCEYREFNKTFDFCIEHETSGICDEYTN